MTTEMTVLWMQVQDVHDVLPRIPSVQACSDVGARSRPHVDRPEGPF